MKKILAAACAACLLLPLAASAEKADALKPINIDFSNSHVDNVTQNYIATGNVVITRGTMILKSDRAEVQESPDGYHTFILTASPGKRSTFRQKRDGGPDLWDEGAADRIEYDERADLVKLFSKAVIKQLEGTKITQEMDSEFISYDNRREVLVGRNDAKGTNNPGGGRGSITLEPHRPPAGAAAPAPATPSAPPAQLTVTPAGKQ
jgi:lipopolysaccharide export system protein LptA